MMGKMIIISVSVVALLAGTVCAAPVVLGDGDGDGDFWASTWSQDPYGGGWTPLRAATPGFEGWSIEQAAYATDQSAVWEVQSDIGHPRATKLDFYLRNMDNGWGLGIKLIGRFKISVTTAARSTFADDDPVDGDIDVESPDIWTELEPVSWEITGTWFPTLEFIYLGDNSLLIDVNNLPAGWNPETTYHVTAYTRLTGITGIRLDALRYASLPNGGPGTKAMGNGEDQAYIGTFWLSEFDVNAVSADVVATIAESNGTTIVNEKNETEDAFDVVLYAQPASDVVIACSPATADVTLNGALAGQSTNLTFTSVDWATPQAVTVKAVDDALQEGNETIKVTFQASSSDTAFDSGLVLPVHVTVIDDDVAGIDVTDGDSVAVSEQGSTSDTYTVVLIYPPTDDVTISLEDSSDPNQVTVTQQLVFTPTDYNIPQTVTVTAIDDNVSEADPHYTAIRQTVTSGDLSYDGFVLADINVTITENDCGAWGYLAGDLDLDCDVDFSDLAIMASNWLGCTTPNTA